MALSRSSRATRHPTPGSVAGSALGSGSGPTLLSSPVARFGFAGLAAVIMLGALTLGAVSRVSRTEAQSSAKYRAELAARGIVEPILQPAILGDGPEMERAVAVLEDAVQSRILSERVVRVKVWTPGGRIVYSDEPQLVGKQFTAKPDHAAALRDGRTSLEVAHTEGPENRFERDSGRLLEVYTPIRTPDGSQLIYEQYERYDSLSSNSNALARKLAIPLGSGLALLWLTQLPLARALASRIRSAEHERSLLFERAVTASERERERIAADLHDGPVQELAGLSYELSAAIPTTPPGELRDTLERTSNIARITMQKLRSSLVDIHPENAHALGLNAAINKLVDDLRDSGMTVSTSCDVPDLSAEQETILYRVAQEFVRNVEQHAHATRIEVCADTTPAAIRLTVRDNGTGFSKQRRDDARQHGHLGLTLHEAIVERAGGNIRVESTPNQGTVAVVEVPR